MSNKVFATSYVFSNPRNPRTIAEATRLGRVTIQADNGLAWVYLTPVLDGYLVNGMCVRPDALAYRKAWAEEMDTLGYQGCENTVAVIDGSGATYDLAGVVTLVEKWANTPWLMTAAVYFDDSDNRNVIAVCPPDSVPSPFPNGGYRWQSGSGRTRTEIIADAEAADDWVSHTQNACGGNNPLCPFCE